MVLGGLATALAWALVGLGGTVSASPVAGDLVPAYQIRNAPGMTSQETLKHLARSLNAVRLEGRDKNLTTGRIDFNRSWRGATLMKLQLYVLQRIPSLLDPIARPPCLQVLYLLQRKGRQAR